MGDASSVFESLKVLAGTRGQRSLMKFLLAQDSKHRIAIEALGVERDLHALDALTKLNGILDEILKLAAKAERIDDNEATALRHLLMLSPESKLLNSGDRRWKAARAIGYGTSDGFRAHAEPELLMKIAFLHQKLGHANTEVPASHRADDAYDLPPLTCLAFHGSLQAAAQQTDVATALREWSGSDSNLLVILGQFGSGKSTLIRQFDRSLRATSTTTTLVDFESFTDAAQLTAVAADVTIIDNVDQPIAVSIDRPSVEPDLRAFRSIIRADGRLIIASRRHRDDQESDELVRQLTNRKRLAGLGVRHCVVLELAPWTWSQISTWAKESGNPEQFSLARRLQKEETSGASLPCNPMTVTMAWELLDSSQSRQVPEGFADLYEAYSDMATSTDYDLGRSAIPGRLKIAILTDVASDVFFGRDHEQGVQRLTLSELRLDERILEHVFQDPTTSQSVGRDWSWTKDFKRYNNLLERVRVPGTPTSTGRWQFRHGSFYEYFVAESIYRNVRDGIAPGLSVEAIPRTTFESLILPFLKAKLTELDIDTALAMAARPRLRWIDRLLLLYLLEETPVFLRGLTSSPPEYIDDLMSQADTSAHFFLGKMALFQLVVLGKVPALDYVKLIQNEDQAAILAERRLHRSKTEPASEVLLRRLALPDLVLAAPITLYRLGQMADERAVDRIREFAELHPQYHQECRAALDRILDGNGGVE